MAAPEHRTAGVAAVITRRDRVARALCLTLLPAAFAIGVSPWPFTILTSFTAGFLIGVRND